MTEITKIPLKFPVGITDFEEFRRKNYYYADKTMFLYQLVENAKPYFLSRPRRFGKSLFLDTLEYVLQGRRDLFKGLWIDESDYDWTPCPVIRLDMSKATADNPALIDDYLSAVVKNAAAMMDIEAAGPSPGHMLDGFIQRLYVKNGRKEKVAVLIDEYDAPIVFFIDRPGEANKAREKLSIFYSMLKSNSKYVGHIFITGVSRFTKTSIFSSLNHLVDLTFDRRFAAICGFTEGQLDDLIARDQGRARRALIDNDFLSEDATDADLKELLKECYDGYSWDGKTKVYNPWPIINVFEVAAIKRYWYESGSPRFLVDLFRSGRATFDLLREIPTIRESDCQIEDINQISTEALLLQTGYLTIEDVVTKAKADGDSKAEGKAKADGDSKAEGNVKAVIGVSYRLGFPNLEVTADFVSLLLSIKPTDDFLAARQLAVETRDRLLGLDMEGLEESFGRFLALFPFDIHVEAEKYYHSMFLFAMILAKQRYTGQEHTSHGILDVRVMGGDGSDHIVEMKILQEEKTKSGGHPTPPTDPEEKARLRERMETNAREALRQITEKYAHSHSSGPGRLVKVALVIARRTVVLARYEAIGRG